MSETTARDPLAAANAIELAETQLVGQVVKIARNAKADPDAIRAALEHLDPADQIRIGDRVADTLQRQAQRTGSFDTLERALPFLPGQSPQERQMLEGAAQQQQALGLDASIVHQALSRVLEDRQPAGADVPGLKEYASQALKDRERLDGPVLLAPEVHIIAGKPPLHDMDQMKAMVGQVQDRTPGAEDRITTEQAQEVRQSLESQFAGARTLRDLNTLRWQEDVEQSMAAIAKHPEQSRLLAAALEAAEVRLMDDKLKGLSSRQPIPEQDVAPGRAFEISRRGEAAAPSNPQDPPSIASRYEVRTVQGEREYYQKDDGQLAMRANDQRIQGVLRDGRTIGAMLDIAASRGWSDVQISGDLEVARHTWIEATARGMRAEGYAPTREDRHQAEQRRIDRLQGIETPRPFEAPSPTVGMAQRHNERTFSQAQGRRPGTAEGWTTQTEGYEGLSPRAKASAERSYETWAKANPELGQKHGLHGYVSYVQEKQAEERERMQPPKVEVPRPSMRL
jgi:hypothetical protein